MTETGPDDEISKTAPSEPPSDPAGDPAGENGIIVPAEAKPGVVWYRSWAMLLGLFAALLVFDLVSKHWAQVDLQHRPRRRIELVKGWLNLSYVRNPAGAWGFMRGMDSNKRHYLLLAVSLAAVGILVVLLARSRPDQTWLRISLTCILAGAVGNIVDRVRWRYVVDFIDWHKGFKWPTFNVADIAITVGVVMMAVEIFLDRPEPEPPPGSGSSDPSDLVEADGDEPDRPAEGEEK
jgi:signal peptidase II